MWVFVSFLGHCLVIFNLLHCSSVSGCHQKCSLKCNPVCYQADRQTWPTMVQTQQEIVWLWWSDASLNAWRNKPLLFPVFSPTSQIWFSFPFQAPSGSLLDQHLSRILTSTCPRGSDIFSCTWLDKQRMLDNLFKQDLILAQGSIDKSVLVKHGPPDTCTCTNGRDVIPNVKDLPEIERVNLWVRRSFSP